MKKKKTQNLILEKGKELNHHTVKGEIKQDIFVSFSIWTSTPITFLFVKNTFHLIKEMGG